LDQVYSLPFLRIWYDVCVLGVNNHLVWKCPTRVLVDHYRRHISANHLEVGVGTGYFLTQCSFGSNSPRLVLLDSNEACLRTTARRLASFHPECVKRSVLDPPLYGGAAFDSIGLNYVLHCLPGSIREKAVVLDHLSALLLPGGVIFGSTLLADGVKRGFLARRHMDVFNALGIFSNSRDSLEDLTRALRERFAEVSIRTQGCAALFSGRKGSRDNLLR